MSKQQLLVWTMSLVAASYALRERAELAAALTRYEAAFPAIDTTGEVVEVES